MFGKECDKQSHNKIRALCKKSTYDPKITLLNKDGAQQRYRTFQLHLELEKSE